MIILEDKKLIPKFGRIENNFITYLEYLTVKLSSDMRTNFVFLFYSIYESRNLAKVLAQFFRFYTTPR